MEPWNDIGIIVITDDGTKNLLGETCSLDYKCESIETAYSSGVDASGISLRKLEDVLNICVYRNITCAIRKLRIKKVISM